MEWQLITLTVNDGTATTQTTFQVTVNTVNDLPTITSIANQTINENNSTGVLAFTVGDVETPLATLSVTGSSNNTSLIPNANIALAGSGGNRTVNVTPLANQNGTATITLTVNDGTATAQTTFQVTVNAINDLPTITAISNQTINENTSTGALAFTVTDAETPLPTLGVTGSSNNTSLVPNANIIVLAGSGGNRTVNVTPLANQGGTAIITLVVNDGTATAHTTFQVTVNAVNDLPTISSIANQTINEDNSTGALAFTVSDAETPLATPAVTGSSNNTSLIPNANIALAGSGGNRTVNVTPLANQNGIATITLIVNDGTATAQTTFQVTVNAINDLPTITSIANQTINENNSTGALAFTVSDVETPLASLGVTGSSNNTSLIPNGNIVLAGSGGNRTVNVTPLANQGGTATITLIVNDGTATAQTTFQVTVNSVNDPPTITSIANQTIPEDSQTGPLAFTIGDAETPIADLTLTPTSSNLGLVPNNQVLLVGAGSMRNVNVIPVINQIGQTTITLELSDGLLSSTTSFNVMVTALDDPPTITPIGDQVINEDSQTGVIAFMVGDLETLLRTLRSQVHQATRR